MKDIVPKVLILIPHKYPVPFGCRRNSPESVIYHSLSIYGFVCKSGFVYLGQNGDFVVIPQEEINELS